MTNPLDQKTNDSYWKYLEENSKVVSTWPTWLKGERSSSSEAPENRGEEPEPKSPNEKLAS